MNLENFSLDTATMAGSLETKLRAARDAGFGQITLSAFDLVEHPGGESAAIAAVHQSGLRPTALRMLQDFEGQPGRLLTHRLDVAKTLLEMCDVLGAGHLLLGSLASVRTPAELDAVARDLRRLAMLAVPLGVRIAYSAISWRNSADEVLRSWNVVAAADRANLGLVVDSSHMLAAQSSLEDLGLVDSERIFLVQLSDVLVREIPSPHPPVHPAAPFRVFPGEGVQYTELAELVRALDQQGYRGDYVFNACNSDYRQMPARTVANRGRQAVKWVADRVSRRSLPVRRAPQPATGIEVVSNNSIHTLP